MFTIPLPDRLAEAFLDDRLFARAYARTDPAVRAWVKTLAAGLHPLMDPHGLAARSGTSSWDNGFSLDTRAVPVGAVVLFLDQTLDSPAQAAAAALPAVLGGAEATLAVRLGPGSGRADGVLAALELCGLEHVCRLDRAGALELLTLLAGLPGGAAALFLGAGRTLRDLAGKAAGLPGLSLWLREPVSRIGVYDPDRTLDVAALRLMHPTADLEVWPRRGKAAGLPAGARPRNGGFPAFLDQGYPAVCAPRDLIAPALARGALVLGPGAEGCFAWPGLTPSLFLRRGLALRRDS
ncbi:MAG: hypothetical protein AB1916_01040 [Thermodesulfobacteriota bacterium]